jgi:hypothetical protein
VIFDTDDLYQGHDRLDLLHALHDANPKFRVTAFAVPALSPDEYVESLPAWIQVVPHGWEHGDPPADGGECKAWSYERMWELIYRIEASSKRWARGFKAPGWQISTDAMFALVDAEWWLADQRYNDERRPLELRIHCEGDGDHVHSHVQNVCGNGLEECFPKYLDLVKKADTFEWISEVVEAWDPAPAAK